MPVGPAKSSGSAMIDTLRHSRFRIDVDRGFPMNQSNGQAGTSDLFLTLADSGILLFELLTSPDGGGTFVPWVPPVNSMWLFMVKPHNQFRVDPVAFHGGGLLTDGGGDWSGNLTVLEDEAAGIVSCWYNLWTEELNAWVQANGYATTASWPFHAEIKMRTFSSVYTTTIAQWTFTLRNQNILEQESDPDPIEMTYITSPVNFARIESFFDDTGGERWILGHDGSKRIKVSP